MAGLTDAGFTRKTLLEIIDSLKQEAKNTFGPDTNTNDDSIMGQLIGTFAIELDQIWQGLEGAYSAYTLSGAEGVYLDDLFSRHNIIRLPATAGSGNVYIESDNTITLPQTIATSVEFSASNNITYNPSAAATIDTEYTSAYKILVDDIALSTNYTIYCEDDSGVTQSTAFSTTGLESSKDDFVNAIETFVNATNTGVAGKVHKFNSDAEFYLGFTSGKALNPLDEEIEFYISPNIGTRYTSVNVVANETGYNPLVAGGISSMSPEFTGFVSVTNVQALTAGTNVETDAEFRVRFNRLIDATGKGCDIDSLESGLINVTNVVDARIYENVTDSIDANLTDPYSYQPVVYGGSIDDIAQLLFDQGPVNVKTSGEQSKLLTTSSGTPVTVKFTYADAVSLDVNITYTTATAPATLTTFEQQLIKDSIVDLALTFGIGSTVYNTQLIAAIVTSLPYGRFATLSVTVDDGGGPSTDFTGTYKEVPTIAAADISFA